MKRRPIRGICSLKNLPLLASFLLPILLFLGVATATRAQNASQQRGFHPGSSYSVSNIETINNQNGNLMLNIPLAALPSGRGGNPGAGVSLIYNSKLWTSPVSMMPNGGVNLNPGFSRTYEERHFLHQSQGGGWRYGFRHQVQVLDRPLEESYYKSYQPSSCPDERATKAWKVRMHFPDGSSSDFVLQGYEGSDYTSWNDGYSNIRPDGARTVCVCTAYKADRSCLAWSRESNPFLMGKLTYYSTDGRYFRLDIEHDSDNNVYNNPWTLYKPDGTRVTGQGMADVTNSLPAVDEQYIYDRNNNFVRIQGNIISDQFGRSITIQYDDPASGGDTITAEGFGGSPLKWTVKWKIVTVHKKLGTCAPWATCTASALPSDIDYKFPLRVVDEVILPAQTGGLSYIFTYNGNTDYNDAALSYGWGEVASVTVPSGAKASYTYLNDGADSLNWQTVLYNYMTVKELTYLREYDGVTATVTEKWLYQVGYNGQNTGTPVFSEVITPDGGKTSHAFYADGGALEGLEFRTINPDGSMVERIWNENIPNGYRYPQIIRSTGSTMLLGGQKPGANTYIKTEFTSVKNAAGKYDRTIIKDYDYDKNGNLTRVAEYDWGPFTDVPRTNPGNGELGVPQGIPDGAQLLRVTRNSYYVGTPDASDITTDSRSSYHKQTSARLRNCVSSTEIKDGAEQIITRAEFTYDDPAITGNLTLRRNWDSTKGALLPPQPSGTRLDASNSVSNRYEYDDNATAPAVRYGNLTLAVDANGNRTKYIYDAMIRPDGTAFTGLYPTTVVTAEGTVVQRTSSNAYDFSTGLVTKVTDEDNQVSTSMTYDALGRSTLVEEADDEVDANNVSLERQTVTEYSNDLRRVITRSDLDSTGDGKLVSVQHYDQLGRVRLSRTLEDALTQSAADERVGIKVQTRYMSSGQNSYQLVSNPYRAATALASRGEETMGWTVATFDQAGRSVRSETFGGADLPAPFATDGANTNSTGAVLTAYDANTITVTDQAGRQRRSVSDGLGRLTNVLEAPNTAGYNYQTSYSYDALGNLTQVEQGAQMRTFNYSSLSRLTSAIKPEACRQEPTLCVPVPITYEYDDYGNLKKKTDARGNTTTYTYDALNRVTFRNYSDLTPDVSYAYDEAHVANSKGQLTTVSSSVSVNHYTAYDGLGRVRGTQQVTDGQSYAIGYEYDHAGNLVSETYPSGRVVRTDYDAAGRVSRVEYASKAYVSDYRYAAHGSPTNMTLGNELRERNLYNTRLQTTEIGLSTPSGTSDLLKINYVYESFDARNNSRRDNNGNVHSQKITAPGLEIFQVYDYDALNRLSAAHEVNAKQCTALGGGTDCWRQVYKYDRYGNRTFDVGTTFPALPPTLVDIVNNPQVDAASNRLLEKQDGDTQKDYEYDREGNVIRNASGQTFAYDGDNMQISFSGGAENGGASYSYDAAGRRVKKVTAAGTTVFVYDAMGKLVAEYTTEALPHSAGGTKYLTADNLDSPRVITDSKGKVMSRHDYTPFGEELFIGRTNEYQPDNIQQQFTGQERDRESGLDYFDARYYSNIHGRFTSIDPLAASGRPGNPQTWNRYAYVLNNPMRFVDPTGMVPQDRTIIPSNNGGPDNCIGRNCKGDAEMTSPVTITESAQEPIPMEEATIATTLLSQPTVKRNMHSINGRHPYERNYTDTGAFVQRTISIGLLSYSLIVDRYGEVYFQAGAGLSIGRGGSISGGEVTHHGVPLTDRKEIRDTLEGWSVDYGVGFGFGLFGSYDPKILGGTGYKTLQPAITAPTIGVGISRSRHLFNVSGYPFLFRALSFGKWPND